MPSASLLDPIHNVGDPLLNNLSSQLNAAREHAIVHSTWFQQVDRILTQSSAATAAEVQLAVTHFYTLALETVQHTLSNGSQRTAYIESLRSRMNNMWDERLVTPAEQFFEKAKALYQHFGQNNNDINADQDDDSPVSVMSISALLNNLVSPDVERAVSEVYQNRLRNPAQQVYDHSVAAYLVLTRKLNQTPDFSSFLQSVQATLGSRYHQQLVQPLNELWTALSNRATSDLSRVHAYLDVDKNGRVSLADLYYAGTSTVSGLVYGTWQSVLRRTKGIVDYALPETNEEVLEDSPNLYESLSINGLRIMIQNRLTHRVCCGYDEVKQLSSKYVVPYTVVDPVAISESLALPVVSEAQVRIQAARVLLQNKREGLQLAIEQYKVAGVNTVSGIAQQATHRVSESLSQPLSNKLNALKVCVIEVAEQSKSLLLHEPILDLPKEAVHVLQSLPSILLLTHPNFKGTDAESQLLQRVENLVEATQQLILWSIHRDESSVFDEFVDESGEALTPVSSASTEDLNGQTDQDDLNKHEAPSIKVNKNDLFKSDTSNSVESKSEPTRVLSSRTELKASNVKESNERAIDTNEIGNHTETNSIPETKPIVKELQQNLNTQNIMSSGKAVHRKKARRVVKP